MSETIPKIYDFIQYNMRNKNNYAFIDGNNLFLGTQSEGWIINPSLLMDYLTNNLRVKKAFYFIGYIQQNINLYKSLRKAGFILIFKRTKKDNHNSIIGNIDADLVFHAMIKINNYYKAIVISGDDDYYCLLKYLAYRKKLSRILIPCKKDCPKLFKKENLGIYLEYLLNKKDKLKYKDCPIKK